MSGKFTVLVLAVLVVGGSDAAFRYKRQASRCDPGVSCVSLSSCQFFQDRLAGGRPSRETVTLIRRSLCNSNRQNVKVCCPDSGPGTPTSQPTPTQPTQPTPTQPTQPTPTQPTQPTPTQPTQPTQPTEPTGSSRCDPGVSCVPFRSCPFFQERLASGGFSRETVSLLRQRACNDDRRNFKVCCPDFTSPTEPTQPSTEPTQPTQPSTEPTQPTQPSTEPTQPTQPSTEPTQPTLPTVDPSEGETRLPATCGRGPGASNKIFFGEDATQGEYPWMAILGYGNREEPRWGCGGALITERYVLTAAHCLHLDFTNGIPLQMLRLGEHNLLTEVDCQSSANPDIPGTNCANPVQDFQPERVIIHPTFNTRNVVSDDIGLVRLDRPATFNVNVQPICVPASGLNIGDLLGEREATVAGWGRTELGRNSDILKKVKLPFVSLESCEAFYPGELVPEQTCFGGDGQRDSCFGDSGGPLFFSASTIAPQYTVLGLVSRGLSNCGVEGVPAIYTNVGAYRTWITQHLLP